MTGTLAAGESASDELPAVAVHELTYTFVGREQPTLRNLSFAIRPGTWTVLAGPTGSGKSTLLRALAGLIPRHTGGLLAGRVDVFGQDTRTATAAEMARLAGLVLQSPDDQICTTSAAAEVAFGLMNLAIPSREIGPRISAALSQVGLTGLEEHRTQQLSGGQKQRLILASILAMQPRLLLLDEPLSQLDAESAHELLVRLDRLRREGQTIVLAEHRLDDVLPYADGVLILNGGALCHDLSASDEQLPAALEQQGLTPPEVTQLAERLGHGPLRSVDEFIAAYPADNRRTVDRTSPSGRPTKDKNQPLAAVSDLSFRFPRSSVPIWQGLNFTLYAGERVALVGPNGSGKSTLLAVLAGLLRPTSGEVRADLAGQDTATGLVLQNPDLMLFCPTVRAELAFGPEQMGMDADETSARVAAAAERMSLAALLNEIPLALSQGQRLRTAVAATLTLHPNILLLDEPTTGQDQPQVARVMLTLSASASAEKNSCLMFSTHDLRSVVRYADRVLVLGQGRLLADCSPAALIEDDALLTSAALRRTPLLEVRHRLQLSGMTVDELAEELRP